MQYIENIAIPDCMPYFDSGGHKGCTCEHLHFVEFEFLRPWGKFGYMTTNRGDIWKYCKRGSLSANEYISNLYFFKIENRLPNNISFFTDNRGDEIQIISQTRIAVEVARYGMSNKVFLEMPISDFMRYFETLEISQYGKERFLKRMKLPRNVFNTTEGQTRFMCRAMIMKHKNH